MTGNKKTDRSELLHALELTGAAMDDALALNKDTRRDYAHLMSVNQQYVSFAVDRHLEQAIAELNALISSVERQVDSE